MKLTQGIDHRKCEVNLFFTIFTQYYNRVYLNDAVLIT